MGTRTAAVLGALLAAVAGAFGPGGVAAGAAAAAVAPGTITELTYPNFSRPFDIVTGPDGNLWFTEMVGRTIQRLTPAGVFTGVPLPGLGGTVRITVGPDGALWFTGYVGGEPNVGRVTTAGAVTELGLGLSLGTSTLGAIVSPPDGALWIADQEASPVDDRIARVTTSGAVTFLPLPAGTDLDDMTVGPDGNVWFTGVDSTSSGIVGRVTATGAVTVFPVPGAPSAITSGPDAKLWFSASVSVPATGNVIGRITTTGVVDGQFPVPSTIVGAPMGIAVGPDGNVWFTELTAGKVASITPAGVITEYALPTAGGIPVGITAGPDGSMWVTVDLCRRLGLPLPVPCNRIGRVTTSATLAPPTTTTPSSAPTTAPATVAPATPATAVRPLAATGGSTPPLAVGLVLLMAAAGGTALARRARRPVDGCNRRREERGLQSWPTSCWWRTTPRCARPSPWRWRATGTG